MKYSLLQHSVQRLGVTPDRKIPGTGVDTLSTLVVGALGSTRPPTSRRGRRRKTRFTDGPFTESKELIGSLWPPNAVRHHSKGV